MFLLYNLLLSLLSPIWVPWMLWRTAKRKESVNWKERQGVYATIPPRGEKRRIWVHAVSVGEVVAVLPLLKELRRALPVHEIVLTVTTSSGHQTARERAGGMYDHLVYFPIDVARFQLAAVQQVRPDVAVIMETELWMNFLWAAKVFDVRTVLVNGRISDRSYPRSMRLRAFYRALLGQLDRCLMQTEVDAERIRSLGAREAEVFGNLKFDQAESGAGGDPVKWRTDLGLAEKPTIVVGSLRAEEFGSVCPALVQIAKAGVQVIIAPRHIERVDELDSALGVLAPRRSRGEKLKDGILVLDSYGELNDVYSVADVVIVGGGFAKLGGQNLLQPLAMGLPVVHGPNMHNFRDVADMAVKAGASKIAIAEDLGTTLNALLSDPALRLEMGASARSLIKRNTGAARRYAAAIADETLHGSKR